MTASAAHTAADERGYHTTGTIGRGPLGERFVVKQRQGGDAILELVDVEQGGERTALCHNSAALVGRIKHPGVASILACGWVNKSSYWQVVDRNPTWKTTAETKSPGTEVPMLRQALAVALALEHLHRREIVHAALAPEAVFSTPAGACLSELWWARTALGESQGELDLDTRTADFARPYQAPECVAGEPPRRPADVYSFGLLMLWWMTRLAPQGGGASSLLATATKVLRPPTLGLIEQMLSREPGERPALILLPELLRHLLGESTPAPD